MGFSKRAQSFISTPVHLLGTSAGQPSRKLWNWSFTLRVEQHKKIQGDKILTLFYFNQSCNIFEALLLETVSRMAIGRDISSLLRLSFRELENFLRDENHLPSFENLDNLSIEKSFKEVKNSLLVALLIKEMKKNENNPALSKAWGQLNLVEKNLKMDAFILLLNNLFPQGKQLQLALATSDEISIVMNDFPLEALLIEELAHELFGELEEISSFKVVAVQ